MLVLSNCFLNAKMPVAERHLDMNQVVLLIAAFVVIILFLTVKLLFKEYFRHLFENLFRTEVTAAKLVESNSAGIQASVLTIVASVISIGSAMMSMVVYGNFSNLYKTVNPTLLIGILIGSVAAYLLFYKLVLTILGWILEISVVTKKYSDMITDVYKVVGIIIFPFFLLLPFSDLWMQKVLIISIITIIILALLVKLVAFFKIVIKIKFFNHYAILYFCIFEIIPILLIVKITSYFVGN